MIRESAIKNSKFDKRLTWRRPFEEKTIYKICLHRMVTKIHGENDGNEATT